MCLLKTIICLLSLLGLPYVAWGITIEVPTEGTLEKVIDDSDEPSFQTLKIVGKLNAADIAYLRTGTGRLGGIQTLDLSEVTLVSGDEAYATIKVEVDDGLMSNATATFYISDENRVEQSKTSNALGGYNYTYIYYGNLLAGAFANMAVKQVVLPKAQKEIGDYTFYKCENLTAVIGDAPFESIGGHAFEGCTSLQDMDLSQVTTMSTAAFAGCRAFRGNEEGTVNLSKLNEIPADAFRCKLDNPNTVVKNIAFSNQLTEIGTYAFYCCTALESIVLPEGLQTIGASAFAECSSLSSVTLPSTVTGLSSSSFFNTPFLSSIPAENGVVYLGNIAIRYAGENINDLVFREGTTEIADGFSSNLSLQSVQFPSTLKRIGSGAFYQAYNLTTIILPEGLEEIGDHAFEYCTGIESLKLPSTLKVIGANAFMKTEKLTTIVLPESLESIGSYAFDGSSLTGEVVIPKNVKQLGRSIFNYSYSSAKVWRINYQAENAVNTSTGGIFNAERLVVGAGVRSLPSQAFRDCSSLKKITFEERTDDAELVIGDGCFIRTNVTEVVLPKGKTEIGGGAFYCSPLASFSTLGTVTKIGDGYTSGGAFEGTQLTEFIVPDGLTHVGDRAFAKYIKSVLTTVHLGNSVKHIGKEVFLDCNLLEDLQFGDQLETIGERAFANCSSLTSFVIPQSMQAIDYATFAGCSFTEITIPEKVKSIGEGAFENCKSLTVVHMPEGVEEIGKVAFKGCDLREFVLPSTIKKLGKSFLGADYESANPQMTDIYSYIQEPSEVAAEDYPFSTAYLNNPHRDVSHYARCVLHVPSGTLQKYRNTDPWSRFTTIVEMVEDENDYAMTTEDISCEKGKTVTLSVSLKNKEILSGVQFDIVVPDGVIVAQDENADMPVVLTDRGDGMSAMYSRSSDNTYTFVIMSFGGSTLKGNNGELVQIPLYVGTTAQEGEQQIELKNIFVTTETGSSRYLKSTTAKLIISELTYTPADVNGDGLVNVTDAVAIANHILKQDKGSFIFEAADMNGDGIINVTDAISVVNVILKK